MIRLLVVLAVVALAALYLATREPRESTANAVPAGQQIEKAQALEKQLQEQADRQLQQIDAGTPQ